MGNEAFIVRRGGGAGKAFAVIAATYPAGSTITCVSGTKKLKPQGADGQSIFLVPYAATWTVTATDGIETTEEVVEITAEGQSVSVELNYRVPGGYQAVVYLESTGEQHIDTGYVSTNQSKIEFRYSVGSLSGDRGLFGQEESGGYGSRFYMLYSGNALKYYKAGVSGMHDLGGEVVGENFIVIDRAAQTCTINGTVNTINPTGYSSITDYIFKAHGGVSNGTPMKLYEMRMYRNGVLERDFVPCYRKSDAVAGLWDVVSKQFHTNVGSGTFIVGEDT